MYSRSHMTIHLLESDHQQNPLFKPLLVAASSHFENLCLSSQIYDPWQDSVGGWKHGGCWPSRSKTMAPRQRTALQCPNSKPIHSDGAAPVRAEGRWKSWAFPCRSLVTIHHVSLGQFSLGQTHSSVPFLGFQAYHHQLPLFRRRELLWKGVGCNVRVKIIVNLLILRFSFPHKSRV